MKILFFAAAITFSLYCPAQQDYIILNNNDTLFGKITRGNLMKNKLTLRVDNKRTKYHLKEIKEYNEKGLKHYIWIDTLGKKPRLRELLLEMDGEVQLLWDIFYDSYVYFIRYKNDFMAVTTNNIKHHLWKSLLHCTAFKERYDKYTDQDVQKMIRLRRGAGIKEFIDYYNRFCSNPITH